MQNAEVLKVVRIQHAPIRRSSPEVVFIGTVDHFGF
jgi:hypothetical protein